MSDGFAKRTAAYNRKMSKAHQRSAWSWGTKLMNELSAVCVECDERIRPSKFCPKCGAAQGD